ncbi:hypothetical protein H6P81_020393 [Aristolochia fimbriata]|uniref:40S ribosomal protein S29 n=1 Tax=Aristolochia fimbriata TaxID=158543 RepID=A0AAV7DUF1_ARIFI|nr:hypothetical protein H6P81_020393 [Aristolochia fimbriata]
MLPEQQIFQFPAETTEEQKELILLWSSDYAADCRDAVLEVVLRRLSEGEMGHSNVWNSHPKNYGPGSRACRVCGNGHGLIRKYGLMCCRQCFRSNAKEIGFIKYR